MNPRAAGSAGPFNGAGSLHENNILGRSVFVQAGMTKKLVTTMLTSAMARILITLTHQPLALPNAPVQARWANAQRAGPASPNPPAVACNRLLASASLIVRFVYILL